MITAQYAAGFFDGEGCVNCAAGRKGTPYIRILVVNTNLEILEMFKATWGGDIKKNSRPKENWKPSYTWRLSHATAAAFLEELLPHLVVKKKQAELAIEFTKLRPGKGRRWEETSLQNATELLNQIKKANKKGVELNCFH